MKCKSPEPTKNQEEDPFIQSTSGAYQSAGFANANASARVLPGRRNVLPVAARCGARGFDGISTPTTPTWGGAPGSRWRAATMAAALMPAAAERGSPYGGLWPAAAIFACTSSMLSGVRGPGEFAGELPIERDEPGVSGDSGEYRCEGDVCRVGAGAVGVTTVMVACSGGAVYGAGATAGADAVFDGGSGKGMAL